MVPPEIISKGKLLSLERDYIFIDGKSIGNFFPDIFPMLRMV
jgi:hypothetical protein